MCASVCAYHMAATPALILNGLSVLLLLVCNPQNHKAHKWTLRFSWSWIWDWKRRSFGGLDKWRSTFHCGSNAALNTMPGKWSKCLHFDVLCIQRFYQCEKGMNILHVWHELRHLCYSMRCIWVPRCQKTSTWVYALAVLSQLMIMCH